MPIIIIYRELVPVYHLISFYQFGYGIFNGYVGREASFFYLLIADDVVSFIGVFADRRFYEYEFRQLLLYFLIALTCLSSRPRARHYISDFSCFQNVPSRV